MQVTEGDGYYLINAQIAALRAYFAVIAIIVDQAHNSN